MLQDICRYAVAGLLRRANNGPWAHDYEEVEDISFWTCPIIRPSVREANIVRYLKKKPREEYIEFCRQSGIIVLMTCLTQGLILSELSPLQL